MDENVRRYLRHVTHWYDANMSRVPVTLAAVPGIQSDKYQTRELDLERDEAAPAKPVKRMMVSRR